MAIYTPHPICELLPPMTSVEYAELRTDIKRHGLHHPITLYQGQILDGRHRYRACVELGLDPQFVEYHGDDPAAFVWSENGTRRNLTTSQRALVAAAFLDYERGEAKKRMQAGVNPPENFPEGGEARDKAGERMGISGRTVEDAESIMKTAVPEVIDKIRSGTMTINEAKTVSKLNPDAQKRIAAIEDKKLRNRETLTAKVRSESCKRRDSKERPVVVHPGTPFLRIWLNAMERTAIIASEHGLVTADEIVARFSTDMDWESEALVAQFNRCVEVIEAMHKIHIRHKSNSTPKLKIV